MSQATSSHISNPSPAGTDLTMVQAVSRLWGQGACGSGQRDRMAGEFQAATRTASAVSYPYAGADSSEGEHGRQTHAVLIFP